MRTLVFYSAALALCAAAHAKAQGSVSQRIAAVRDGVVRMQYDSRPGVCGDGGSMVSYHSAVFARDFSGLGRMNDRRCVTGDASHCIIIIMPPPLPPNRGLTTLLNTEPKE
jgi:hypothetical protein